MLTAKRKKEIDLIIKKHLEGKLDADDIDDKLNKLGLNIVQQSKIENLELHDNVYVVVTR